jgi:uncharacterized protein (DUF1800 family)
VSVLALVFLSLPVFSQSDPDPNSPSPVLLGTESGPRALAAKRVDVGKVDLRSSSEEAFAPGSKVALFVTNIDLMSGEGASAFRVYAEDWQGHSFRFPVLDLRTSSFSKDVYMLTVKLTDELKYWDAPQPADLSIMVTWRGLASNKLRLGYGQTGGNLKDPAPAAKYDVAAARKNGKQIVPDYIGYKYSGDRIRFLEQATFGPNAALDMRIRRIGLRTWLAEQFEIPYPSASNPYPNLPLKPTNAPADCDGDQTTVPDVPVTCFRDTYTMYPIQTWFYREAFYGEPQLRHRVTWALNQIWVISGVSTQQSSHMIAYHQAVSRNAFGNWRQLMSDMTLNPAMGNYLDMMRSTKNNPNENYPREVLQLFNIGLFMLNPDGTQQLDGQGNPIPTYDQTTVNNFTKVFTGWRDCNVPASCPNIAVGTVDYKDPMLLVPNNHDLTAKTLLAYTGSTTTNIPACTAPCTSATDRTTYANNSLNQALDNIYNHPNVAPFVSKLLIQHLVTSDPTPAYVGRVSAVFNANRTSPTQLQEVVRAILLDPEARGDVKTAPDYGKLREPAQLATNMMRQFNVTGATGFPLSDGHINPNITPLGENVFNSPTVFNFYPPDYVVPGTSVLGPEFAIFTTGTSIGRANLADTFAMKTGLSGGTTDRPNGTRLDLAEAQAYAAADATGNQLMNFLDTRLMHGTMSAQMRSTILNAVTVVPSNNPLLRTQTAIYLVVTSSQYQVQR